MTPPPEDGRAGDSTGNGAASSSGIAEVSPIRQGAIVGTPYREETTFQTGELILGRFKILRFIAKGGAGEVYEAKDLELRCPVALKVARPEISENEHALERFRREIALARQVTHPNVCRIFDVFRVELPPKYPGGAPRRTLFLTMELLTGESLAARLHRAGPLDPEEALPLIGDMASGLAAAHRAGVIHRDFKSANVVLVQEEARLRAVITDFGLARGLLADEVHPETITHSGTVVGTPTYMAPEQLTGGLVTEASDAYSLGIVIYEMVTGHRPFKGDTDLSTAIKRLTDAPPSPRLHAPQLDLHWEQAILRCLEREPEDRFPNLDNLVKVLTGDAISVPPPRVVRKRRRHLLIAAIAAPAILGVGYLGVTLVRTGGETNAAVQTLAAPPTVAVLAFKNLSGRPDSDWLSTALAEALTISLRESPRLNTVARESVDRTSAALGLETSSSFAEDTLARIRDALDADLVIDGSFLARGEEAGGEIRLSLRMRGDFANTSLSIIGNESDVFELVERAKQDLLEELNRSEAGD